MTITTRAWNFAGTVVSPFLLCKDLNPAPSEDNKMETIEVFVIVLICFRASNLIGLVQARVLGPVSSGAGPGLKY